MAELLALGLQVFFGVLAGSDFAGNTFHNLDAGFFEGVYLVGIVRKQAHAAHAQRLEDLAGECEIAVVGFEPKPLVGFYRIQACVLQLVSLKFRHQAYAAAFLLLVDENPRALLRDHGKRELELLAAVATQRMKNIAREALRMHAHQRGFRRDIAHDKRDSFFDPAVAVFAMLRAETVDAELSPAGREFRRGDLLNWAGHTLIIAVEAAPNCQRMETGPCLGHRTVISRTNRGVLRKLRKRGGEPDVQPIPHLSTGTERENGILLGGNRSTVAGGWAEMPVLECGQAFVVYIGA